MARIDDGFSTTIDFTDLPTVTFYEKTVTPPGMDGGGPNDTTTMLNTAWRTKAPKKLKSLTTMTLTAAYDPAVYTDIVGANGINNNQEITVNFPDGSTLVFWGWIDKFTPNEIVEGEQPTAEVIIECSNQDAAGAEIAPVYTAPAP